MKKFLGLICTIILFNIFLGITPVSAMTEDELYAKFTKVYDFNGSSYKIKESDRVLLRRYLDSNEVSAKDCDYIANKLDEAIELIRKSGAKNLDDFSKLPQDVKDKLKQMVTDIDSNTSVKATVSNGALIIYNEDGSVFAEVEGMVKNTGKSINVIVLLAIITALLGSIILVKNAKAKTQEI